MYMTECHIFQNPQKSNNNSNKIGIFRGTSEQILLFQLMLSKWLNKFYIKTHIVASKRFRELNILPLLSYAESVENFVVFI